MLQYLSGFLVIIFLLGCQETTVTPKLGETFTVKAEKSVTLANNLKVTFVTVQDNRCPQGVQCIRQGELLATLLLEEGSDKKQIQLCVDGECLPPSPPQTGVSLSGSVITVGQKSYKITLVSFMPTVAKQGNTASAYSLQLKLESN